MRGWLEAWAAQWRTRRRIETVPRATALALTLALAPAVAAAVVTRPAAAAPFVGVGQAQASEWKRAPATKVIRARALRRARTEAIKAALAGIEGVDTSTRKSVLSSHAAWTSAYRVLSEQRVGDTIRLEIEVDLDLARLTKRVGVSKRAGTRVRPRFALGTVSLSDGALCGDPEALPAAVADELAAIGAVVTHDPDAASVDLRVVCEHLGAVRYTHMRAARVQVTAVTQGRVVATVLRNAFADDDAAAVQSGLAAALFDLGARLATHQRGAVTLSVQSAGPGARVRRLERAIREGVLGVDAVHLSGLKRGAVMLSLSTDLGAATLARRLAALSLPEFSVKILHTEEPDAITIRLR